MLCALALECRRGTAIAPVDASPCLCLSAGRLLSANLHRPALSNAGGDPDRRSCGRMIREIWGMGHFASGKQAARSQKPEARSQKPEARSQKPEARSQKPEADDSKFKTKRSEARAGSKGRKPE